jgi:hypothetical protein
VTLTAVNAISAMVAPVVLLTTGGLLPNGLLTVYNSINDRLERLTQIDEAPRLVLAGAACLISGLAVAARSLAKSAGAAPSAVERTQAPGRQHR